MLTLQEQQRIEGLEYEIIQLKDEVNHYKFQGSQGWVGNQTIQSGYLQSSNFVQSSSGFRLTADGIIYATGAVISGSITATSGTIGGWSINATSIYTGTEDHAAYTANAGDMTIYSDGADSSVHSFNWYLDTSGNFHARDGDMTGVEISGIPNTTATDISLLTYTHTLVFSASDNDTVAWAAGTITLSNARTFSIDAGNTGNMAALSWIYLDTGVSSTVLQVTTTAATAMGANKIVLAIAQNNADASANATFVVSGGTMGIAITAGSIKTATLSAITADLGSITAGTVTGATLRTSSSNPKFNITSTTFQGINTAGAVVFEVIITGADQGDVIMGDDATGSYAKFDASVPDFKVFADNVPVNTQGTFGGDGTNSALALTSSTTDYDVGAAAVYVRNWTSISITSTAQVTFSNPHANGTTVIWKSQGNVTITSTGSPTIDLRGLGAAGGDAGTPTAAKEPNALLLNANSPIGVAGSGASGGAAGSRYDTPNFYTTTEALLSRRYIALVPGAGGGYAEQVEASATGGDGGRGGGAFLIECAGALNFGASSVINSSGSAGVNGTTATGSNEGSGAGGGGSAGTVAILYNTLTTNAGTITASGGAGGNGATAAGTNGAATGGGGGAGSVAAAGGAGGNVQVNGSAGAGNGGGGGGGGGDNDVGGTAPGTGGAAGGSMSGLVAQNYYFA